MTDEEKLNKLAADIERTRLVREHDVETVMRTQQGRRFVWDLLDRIAGLHSLSYVENSDRTTFGEGQRSVAIVLLSELQVLAPHLVRTMVMERFVVEAAEAPKHETNQT